MPFHEPLPDDYEPISELILNLDLNHDKEEELEEKNLPPNQIVYKNMEGNTVSFPELFWDFEQLPIFIFGNQNVVLLLPNEENSHLLLNVPLPVQQTDGNVFLQNMDENKAPLPKFEKWTVMNFSSRWIKKLKLCIMNKLTTEAMRTERKVKCFTYRPTDSC